MVDVIKISLFSGDDAIINVWSILDILDDAYKSPGRRMMKPYAEFTNHSLSVTVCVILSS